MSLTVPLLQRWVAGQLCCYVTRRRPGWSHFDMQRRSLRNKPISTTTMHETYYPQDDTIENYQLDSTTVQAIIKIFFNYFSKAIVDLFLLTGFVLVLVSARHATCSWWSFHCVASIMWYLLILIHIGQHWQMTQFLLKWNRKILKRNIITFITIIGFILLTCSIILFMVDVNDKFVCIHHAIASPLRLMIIIHAITKAKRFLACFR